MVLVDLRGAARAVALAFAMALAASLAITAERLTAGAGAVSLASVGLVAGIAIVTMVEARALRALRIGSVSLIALQIAGVLAAIGVVHVVIAVAHPHALVERPAQLVNDLVLAGSALTFAWSHTVRSTLRRAAMVAAAVFSLLAYWATAARWHCDAGQFVHPVQLLVVHKVLLVAAVLLSLDVLAVRD